MSQAVTWPHKKHTHIQINHNQSWSNVNNAGTPGEEEPQVTIPEDDKCII